MASTGLRVDGFSHTPMMNLVSRSPTSSRGPSPIASGAWRAGAKATSMAASKICSLVPK